MGGSEGERDLPLNNMKKELLKYRLEPLLEMKRRARKKAEIALARAIVKLEQEKKKLKKLEEEKKEIIQKRKNFRLKLHERMVSGDAHAKDGWAGMNFLRKLEDDEKKKDEEIERQKEVIENCEIQLKRAKRDYIDAVKEQRVMEKHKELWKKKVDQEITRAEEREMDELGNVIHQLKANES